MPICTNTHRIYLRTCKTCSYAVRVGVQTSSRFLDFENTGKKGTHFQCIIYVYSMYTSKNVKSMLTNVYNNIQ